MASANHRITLEGAPWQVWAVLLAGAGHTDVDPHDPDEVARATLAAGRDAGDAPHTRTVGGDELHHQLAAELRLRLAEQLCRRVDLAVAVGLEGSWEAGWEHGTTITARNTVCGTGPYHPGPYPVGSQAPASPPVGNTVRTGSYSTGAYGPIRLRGVPNVTAYFGDGYAAITAGGALCAGRTVAEALSAMWPEVEVSHARHVLCSCEETWHRQVCPRSTRYSHQGDATMWRCRRTWLAGELVDEIVEKCWVGQASVWHQVPWEELPEDVMV